MTSILKLKFFKYYKSDTSPPLLWWILTGKQGQFNHFHDKKTVNGIVHCSGAYTYIFSKRGGSIHKIFSAPLSACVSIPFDKYLGSKHNFIVYNKDMYFRSKWMWNRPWAILLLMYWKEVFWRHSSNLAPFYSQVGTDSTWLGAILFSIWCRQYMTYT